jgi:hypothetical protein
MNQEFKSSTATRFVFAAAAVVITASIGGFIDHLATNYAPAPHAMVEAATPRMASMGADS